MSLGVSGIAQFQRKAKFYEKSQNFNPPPPNPHLDNNHLPILKSSSR
jgi:hypothetical protein